MSQMAGLLERDRVRFGFTVGQAAYRLGLTSAQYRALLEEPRDDVRHLGRSRAVRVASDVHPPEGVSMNCGCPATAHNLGEQYEYTCRHCAAGPAAKR